MPIFLLPMSLICPECFLFLDNKPNYRFIRSNSADPNEPLMIYIGEKPVYDAEKYIPVPVPRGTCRKIYFLTRTHFYSLVTIF
jgi:hypothetical protein